MRKWFFNIGVPFGRIGLTQLALFSKHLSVMLRAGIPIAEALLIAKDSSTSERLRKILTRVSQSVQAGQSLSSSLAHHPEVFSELFLGSVYAGESSGTLDQNLEAIAVELEKERELATKIRAALFYPAVILVAAFALSLFLAFFILPKLLPLLKGLNVQLPFTTRLLIWFGDVIQHYHLTLLIGILILAVFISWLVRQPFLKPLTHGLFLHLPVIKRLSLSVNLARFCRTLGTLLKSGINVDEALAISQHTVGNYYYKKALGKVSIHVSQGAKLSENLAQFENIFPKLVTRMVRVGEESGKLEETLFYLAGFYEVEVDASTKSLSATIEPLLLLGVGLVVAFVALAIITPIFEFTGSIGR